MSSHFDLVDFRLFANIAEASSFTAGAEVSNISTSAASIRIRHLEESLGCKLFHRTSQGSTLTDAGEACLHHVQAILDQFDQMKSALSQNGALEGPTLRIAVSSAGVHGPLPGIMREYSLRHPNVKLVLNVTVSPQVVPAVMQGAADIGIGGNARPGTVDVLPYLRDRLVLLMLRDHPLADRASIRFAEALDYQIIGFPPLSNPQIFMSRIAQNSRKPLLSSVTVSSFEALFQMVEAGIGISVVSRQVARLHTDNSRLRTVELKDRSADSDINICVARLRDLSPHAREFVALLRDRGQADSQGTTNPPSTGMIAPVI